ncbi:MAG: hypothetical protein ACI35P_16540 [Bacillus sp. (in: firmicutes)]
MTFRIKPLKGLYKRENYCHQLKEAEAVQGYKRYMTLLFFISVCVYAVSAAFGIGTEMLSKEITSISSSEFEAKKQLFFIGRIIVGIAVPCIILLVSALYYWSFLNLSYRKLVSIHFSVFCIFLIEKVVEIPLFLLLNIDATSNPFSLGIVAQYVTSKELIVQFFSQITIFQVWMIATTCYYLKRLSEQKLSSIILLVTSFFLFCWIITSLLEYIKMGIFM